MPSSVRVATNVVVLALLMALVPCVAVAQGPQAAYEEVLGREEILRKDLDARTEEASALLQRRIRTVVAEYEAIVGRYPRSGYSDNALYQAAVLSGDAFSQFGEEADRKAARRLFRALRARYPTSSLNRQVMPHMARLDAVPKPAPAPPEARPLLKAIRREALPGALRIILELEREVGFHEERLNGPPRVFVDLQHTTAVETLRDATLGFTDDVVRQIRVGRRLGATRVVLDLQGAARHSVYALYDPYRVVIDFERPSTSAAGAPPEAAKETKRAHEEPGATWTPEVVAGAVAAPEGRAATREAENASAREPKVAPTVEAGTPPTPPATNSKGGFSLSRQLGLGISRVVIDAGHGGHDPGARIKGLNEADLTLDVALRLEKLLLTVPGVDVVLTRRTNVYIPLEERTAIANRAAADLFLSIHVNASANSRAKGIETYFLNFAPSAEAEAIAARENAGSSRTMHNLPDIVKAIALNNKLDESRDFASLVQSAMYERLRKANREAKSLGVKQAPFMVLVGATMPSVLAEISFITNRQEAALLRTPGYRQAIADALFAGVSRYQRSLKSAQTVAAQ